MSHLSQIATGLRSKVAILATAQALGIRVREDKTISSVYQGSIQADIAFGEEDWLGFTLGLKYSQEDETYSLLGDPYDFSPAARKMALKFGPDMLGYKNETREIFRHGKRVPVTGHVATGHPTLFLQEYNIQCGLLGAQAQGMSCQRIPQPNGDVLLRMAGGNLPQGAFIDLLSKTDGSSVVAPFNIKGPSCREATSWLEAALGRVTACQLTPDFSAMQGAYNAPQAAHTR